jgi:hypothetical protein
VHHSLEAILVLSQPTLSPSRKNFFCFSFGETAKRALSKTIDLCILHSVDLHVGTALSPQRIGVVSYINPSVL